MNYSAFRKYSQYHPEAVLLAEEIKSMGIEAVLEQRFYREGTYYCPKHGKFTDEDNPDLEAVQPAQSLARKHSTKWTFYLATTISASRSREKHTILAISK